MSVQESTSAKRLECPVISTEGQKDSITELALEKMSFSEMPPELQLYTLSKLPVGMLFRCLFVSTQWNRMVISLPEKKHHKLKQVISLFRDSRNLLKNLLVSNDRFLNYLSLETFLDTKRAKATFAHAITLVHETSPTERLHLRLQVIPLMLQFDSQECERTDLDPLLSLQVALLKGNKENIAPCLQSAKERVQASGNSEKILLLLEIAADRLQLQEKRELLALAKRTLLGMNLKLLTKKVFLRAIDIYLKLDTDQMTFSETKNFLHQIDNQDLQAAGMIRIAEKEIELNPVNSAKTLRDILFSHPKAANSIGYYRLLASLDWQLALRGLTLTDPIEYALALETITLSAVERDLEGFTGAVEQSPNSIFRLLGWLAIAKKEAEMGLKVDAEKTLEKVVLLQDIQPSSPERHNIIDHRIARIQALINPDTALTTIEKITDVGLRLDALLFLASYVAEKNADHFDFKG